ncbi:hypothetical protein NPIL_160411, partial [Nephila pilipes]
MIAVKNNGVCCMPGSTGFQIPERKEMKILAQVSLHGVLNCEFLVKWDV